MPLFDELKRRNVIRTGAAYVVSAWFLLQVADLVLEHTGAPAWVFQSLALLLAIGLPVVLVFAWAFEITPEGVKRERDVDRSAAGSHQTARKLDLVTILVAALLVGFILADRLLLQRSEQRETTHESAELKTQRSATAAGDPVDTGPSTQSIAVLPFVAMSRGEDDEYFADGLTEEIINSLAALPELLVTARTSAFYFKGKDLPIPEIARQLGVAHIVEGSVRRAGDQLRITAQVIRAEDGFHLWSQTYDRGIEDVFAVQENIALSIATILDVVLDEQKRTAMRQAGINDVAAFIAMQKARAAFVDAHRIISRTTELLEGVTPLFDQVLLVAPDLVAARILRADAPAHVLFDYAIGRPGHSAEAGAELALAELRTQYEAAWSYAVPGNQRDILDVERAIFDDDWTGLKEKLERALKPGGCVATNWTLEMAMALGYWEQALQKSQDKLRCDPFDQLSHAQLALTLIFTGQPDQALKHTEEIVDRGLEFGWIDDLIFYSLLALGELDDPRLDETTGSGAWISFPRELIFLAMRGEGDKAREIAESYWEDPATDDWSRLVSASMLGNRELANAAAARIDQRIGSSFVLNNVSYVCMCGLPFDLVATPNYARRLKQAGIELSPPVALRFPDKDW